MGGSYGHLVARGASLDDIVTALGNEPAFLLDFGTTTAIFSRAAAPDPHGTAVELSRLIPHDVIAFMVFDDDVFAAALCRAGEMVAEVTVPTFEEYTGIDPDDLELMAEWMGEDTPSAGNVNDPTGFVMGVGTGDLRRALHVLSDDYGGSDHVFATDRHRDLLSAMELPPEIAGWDYYGLEAAGDQFTGPTPTRINS